jgi:hypothetical protein
MSDARPQNSKTTREANSADTGHGLCRPAGRAAGRLQEASRTAAETDLFRDLAVASGDRVRAAAQRLRPGLKRTPTGFALTRRSRAAALRPRRYARAPTPQPRCRPSRTADCRTFSRASRVWSKVSCRQTCARRKNWPV